MENEERMKAVLRSRTYESQVREMLRSGEFQQLELFNLPVNEIREKVFKKICYEKREGLFDKS